MNKIKLAIIYFRYNLIFKKTILIKINQNKKIKTLKNKLVNCKFSVIMLIY